MENCCANLCGVFKKQKQKQPEKPRPNKCSNKLVVLREATGREIRLQYELGRELGRGEFGITYLCKDRETGEELACKSISKNKLRTAIDIEDLRRQVEIMRHLPKHPNIVSLKYTYEDDDNVHLVMELCQGGDLLDRIVRRGDYTEHSTASVIKTIVQVVQMCHKHGVMHRNLKPENFLFADKKEKTPLKVTDFRSSIFFKPGERLNQMVGNLYYMAPEVLKRNYGPEIDIWSAGVILYILLCGFPPFWAETEQGVAQKIIGSVIDFNREPWPKVSVSLYAADLVTKMLDPDPKHRLTAKEVLDHPWFKFVKKKPDTEKDLVKKILTTYEVLDRPLLINLLKEKPDKAKGLAKKMLTAHEVLDYPNTVPNVSLGETVRGKLLQFSVMNQLTKTTSRFDGDKDGGCLDYGKFLDISVHLRKRYHEEQYIDRAFQFFDEKQSGYIELEELRKALAKSDTTSQKVINAIMNDVATNKDGRISYEEITNWSFKPMIPILKPRHNTDTPLI